MSVSTVAARSPLDRVRLWMLPAFVVGAVACQLIAHPTKDKGGFEGAVSWIAFVGLWVFVVAFAASGLALLVRAVRTR